MKKYSLWQSTITLAVYEMPLNWFPLADFWVCIGVIEK